MGTIGNWKSGSTPNRKNIDFYENGTIPWLVTGDLNDGIIKNIPNRITELAYTETSLKLNPKGSVCIAMYGATIGKLGILDFPATTNQACCVCSDFKGIDNLYLFYCLKQHKNIFIQQGFGGAQPNISKEKITSTLVPLPPLAEQKRIVSEIERIFSLIDSLEKNKSTLQLAVKQAKSKILDLAIHGKLVPQDPADEPASVLLEKLRAEKEAKIKAGELKRDKNDSYIYKSTTDNCHYQKFANGTEEEVDVPYDLPNSWRWEKIGNIFEINPKVTGDDSKNASFIPMEKISAQNKNEFSFEASNWGKIKKNHTQFKDGDVCFAKISPCFENGKAFIAKNLINGIGAGTTELIVLRNECFDKKYTFYFLANPLFIGDCCSTFNGVVGQQRIGTDIIRNYYFPVPPLNEQKRIVSKINEIYNFLDLIIKNIV